MSLDYKSKKNTAREEVPQIEVAKVESAKEDSPEPDERFKEHKEPSITFLTNVKEATLEEDNEKSSCEAEEAKEKETLTWCALNKEI